MRSLDCKWIGINDLHCVSYVNTVNSIYLKVFSQCTSVIALWTNYKASVDNSPHISLPPCIQYRVIWNSFIWSVNKVCKYTHLCGAASWYVLENNWENNHLSMLVKEIPGVISKSVNHKKYTNIHAIRYPFQQRMKNYKYLVVLKSLQATVITISKWSQPQCHREDRHFAQCFIFMYKYLVYMNRTFRVFLNSRRQNQVSILIKYIDIDFIVRVTVNHELYCKRDNFIGLSRI